MSHRPRNPQTPRRCVLFFMTSSIPSHPSPTTEASSGVRFIEKKLVRWALPCSGADSGALRRRVVSEAGMGEVGERWRVAGRCGGSANSVFGCFCNLLFAAFVITSPILQRYRHQQWANHPAKTAPSNSGSTFLSSPFFHPQMHRRQPCHVRAGHERHV